MLETYRKDVYCRDRQRGLIKRYFIKWLDRLARLSIPPSTRIFFYRLMGIKIGSNVFIGMDCLIDSSFPELIIIEDEVVISFRVMIICHDDAGKISENERAKIVSSVVLKEGCYIGAGVVILPGITIGENAVVGAGAIVTGDVKSNTVVAGNPARKIKDI